MISDAWKLCERLSVVQAALLISGQEPTKFTGKQVSEIEKDVLHFLPVKTALLAAIEEIDSFGTIVWGGGDFDNRYIDCHESYVRVETLRSFLKEKGLVDNYFTGSEESRPGYLQPDHPRYAPQLSAAVEAWMRHEDPEKLQGKTPKKAIEKWLRENASRFGMTNEDGSANESGIERIARICNWLPQGGAPATPASSNSDPSKGTQTQQIRLPSPEPDSSSDFEIDDEIPF